MPIGATPKGSTPEDGSNVGDNTEHDAETPGEPDREPGPVRRLKDVATALWGDAWVIERKYWADGDTQTLAIRNHGRNDDGHRIQDRLLYHSGGRIGHERVTIDATGTIQDRTVVAEDVRDELENRDDARADRSKE